MKIEINTKYQLSFLKLNISNNPIRSTKLINAISLEPPIQNAIKLHNNAYDILDENRSDLYNPK